MIINLTQHAATPSQREDGVVDLPQEFKEKLSQLLTFNSVEETREMSTRASAIFELVRDFLGARDHLGQQVMVGGAPAFMPVLENYLRNQGVVPRYSFSVRDSVEVTNPDGTVTKKQVFRHGGWWY